MTSSLSRVVDRSPITIAAGFIGAFIVGSLAVQLVRSHVAAVPAPSTAVEPVIAGPSALWSTLGEQDVPMAQPQRSATSATATSAAATSGAALVVGSEATLWSALGER